MNILDALSYPILRGGWIMILVGAVFSVILGVLQSAFIIGLAVAIFSAGYFGSFYLSVVNMTMLGEDKVPDWPSFSSFWDDIISPFFRLLVLGLLSFLPLLILFFLEEEEPAVWWLPAVIAAGLWGCFYFPMSVLSTLAFGGIGAASPHIVLPAIFRSMPAYLLVVVALIVGFILTGVVQHFSEKVPYLGWFLSAAVGLYSMMFQGRLIGLLYREKAWKLGWS